jgi:dihydroorotate dehydrogenase electron transfer subunit
MSNDIKKGICNAQVLSNDKIRKGYYRLTLQLDSKGWDLFSNAFPGQFLELDLSNVSLSESSDIPVHVGQFVQKQVLLRRPFSFSDVSITNSEKKNFVKVELLYRVLGPATVRMMNLKKSDRISVLGPLGNGFSIPKGLKQAILIAGGMGAPPILHLASYLKKNYPKCQIISFIGAKSCDDFPFSVQIDNLKGFVLEEFETLQVPSKVSTDDGSAGYQGNITDCVSDWLKKNKIDTDSTILFACGPEPMLAATASLAQAHHLICQVSMERMMACGIGLCQSCVVETKKTAAETEYHLCCKEGPVFDAKDVIFLAE